MPFDPTIRRRRSIRLKGYDYRQPGAYFVTICTHRGASLFGEVIDGQVVLNAIGRIALDSWEWLATQYDYVDLDEYVIMPNHMHGILMITVDGRGSSRTASTNTRKPLGRLIGAFKTVSTKSTNQLRNTPGQPVWQRNYYEHVIRSNNALNRIRAYIHYNPAKWHLDPYRPGGTGQDDFIDLLQGQDIES